MGGEQSSQSNGQREAALSRAFRAACVQELLALKPGNVGRGRPARGMTTGAFRLSAWVAAPRLVRSEQSLGERIHAAAERVHRAVGYNTVLGILLLAAPLLEAGRRAGRLERGRLRADPHGLRNAVIAVVDGATVADTDAVNRAIQVARPGGLGTAPRHDVTGPATVPLKAVMEEAAGYDRVAREYATGFAETFEHGLPTLHAGLQCWSLPWATTYAYLELLARDRDSHVARRHGGEPADALREEAWNHRDRLRHLLDDNTREPAGSEVANALEAWDQRLRDQGINPGTCADLTVATLLAHALTQR